MGFEVSEAQARLSSSLSPAVCGSRYRIRSSSSIMSAYMPPWWGQANKPLNYKLAPIKNFFLSIAMVMVFLYSKRNPKTQKFQDLGLVYKQKTVLQGRLNYGMWCYLQVDSDRTELNDKKSNWEWQDSSVCKGSYCQIPRRTNFPQAVLWHPQEHTQPKTKWNKLKVKKQSS